MTKKSSYIRTICEAAIMLALSQVLSYIRLFEFHNGGSVDIAMLPMIFFAVRHGFGWGLGTGFIYGIMQYVFGNGIAIDWTTIIADYMLAYAVMGGCAGLFKGKSWSIFAGCIAGSAGRFIVHLIVGAVVWGKWMPPEFFGMTMTSPWFYSMLYNGAYMLPDMALITVLAALIYKPLRKYMVGDDIIKAKG
ncbi:MAG: energy-coupled thiamine transporter ThiT [Oscillospiraceae bacterium]|jgi:thiamine transporter|nr:energy-coupled thiamine transporter ThiT [Oscillospiraceae bacterium]